MEREITLINKHIYKHYDNNSLNRYNISKIKFLNNDLLSRYIGYNEEKINYAHVYIINNKYCTKKKFNLLLQQESIKEVHIIHPYIICVFNNHKCVYKRINNIFLNFYYNIKEIFNKDKLITILFCLKHHDFYLCLLFIFKYNYYILYDTIIT